MKLKDVALLIAGEARGGHDIEIKGVAGISDAKEGDITFIASEKYSKKLKASKASCVIVKDFIPDLTTAQIKVPDPHYAFARLLRHFFQKPIPLKGISERAFVADDARIEEDVSVAPFACISSKASIGRSAVIHSAVFIGEGVDVGEDSIIYPNVVLREGVSIGSRVIIHSGTVIGSDGFGYIFREGSHYKIPQVGGVIIGDDVEIGANVTIDRATTGNTIVGRGTKIDNLVQIGHNVKIGEHCIIVAQVGIGGSAEIGNFVTIGGQVGISDHTVIEDGVMAGARSGLMGTVSKGVYSGTPAIPHIQWLKAVSLFSRLPELQKRLRLMEEKIEGFQRRLGNDRD